MFAGLEGRWLSRRTRMGSRIWSWLPACVRMIFGVRGIVRCLINRRQLLKTLETVSLLARLKSCFDRRI